MSVARIVEPRNVDLSPKNRGNVALSLDKILHGTYELLVSTQLVHWNAKGELFLPVHKLTEEHYGELFQSLDVIAERMRALGTQVPAAGGNTEFSVTARIAGSNVREMVAELIKLHEAATMIERDAAGEADKVDDIGTSDMLVDCIKFHEKAIWMLRAIID